MKYVKTSLTQI